MMQPYKYQVWFYNLLFTDKEVTGSFHNEGPLKVHGRYHIKNGILGSQDRFLKVVFPLWRLSLKHLRYSLSNNGIKFISKTQGK